MNSYLIAYDGSEFQLPVLLEWRLSYGCELPCDAFEIALIYDKSMLTMLTNAVRFRAEHNGDTVFMGVVDDFEVSISENGCIVIINGRGLAALLIDNEAEAAQYYSLSLEGILDKYVYPYGIQKIRQNTSFPKQALVVDSGTSLWGVLEDFMWFGAGVRPRFSKEGTLILGEESGNIFAVDEKTAVVKQVYKYKRYGVISEVLVKNKALGTSQLVSNSGYAETGGCCRRVINVPRKTRYDSMRMTGEYQIARSKEKERQIILTLPSIFEVFPGDTVVLAGSQTGVSGEFGVSRTVCFADGDRAGTEIILG